MKNTAIIIPSRLGAKRFPNKPLMTINNVPMIIHVFNRAKESKVGEVIVATPDNKILDIVKKNGGRAILTEENHSSGTDRVHEVYFRELKDKVDLIINLQGDMPNINPKAISKLEKLMRESDCKIGTLAAKIEKKEDIENPNIVKVDVCQDLGKNDFLSAKDFFRTKSSSNSEKIYHHIGIYAFTTDALTKYVNLPRSKMEIYRKLEQMRAIENNLQINVGLSDAKPKGVDTQEDLTNIKKEMK